MNDQVIPRGRTLFISVAAIAALAVIVQVVVNVFASTNRQSGLIEFVCLAAAAAIGARADFALARSVSVSGMFIPLVAAAVVIPDAAPLLGICCMAIPHMSNSTRIFNAAVCTVSVYVASVIAGVTGMPSNEVSVVMWSSVLAGSGFFIVNAAIIATYMRSVWRIPLSEVLPPYAASFLASGLFCFPIVGAVAYATLAVGAWTLPLILIPLSLVVYFHGLYHKKAQLTEELADVNEVLAKTNLQFAAAMIRALDARDAYTAGHSAAVAVYTRDIARESGCDEKTVRLAHLAGLLHDIGKIGVPGSVLNKTAPLDDGEYEQMKEHARIGAEILGEVDSYSEISTLVRHHHERIDGTGYPDRIGGDFIPSISRMISVADTYSAMTTDRPYRQGMPTEKAMAILGEASGSGQLDEMYTAVFLRILRNADPLYQRGKQTSFEVEVAKHEALGEFEQQVLAEDMPAAVPTTPGVDDVDIEKEVA